ncbi:hypothetical protein BD311DRAFT_470168 [Dichomitus squalens]|uniref:Uncharacterized protein n=1 Tax=Dichomitus squalens TaxID=114155 RepID=A0A4Q9MEY8_9APHY|nr:hypothetical protein BD311DRAFT_470168 [Dichomitus squalens]
MPACNKHACQDSGSCASKHSLHTTPWRSRLRSTLVDLFSPHELVWPGDCWPLSRIFRLDSSAVPVQQAGICISGIWLSVYTAAFYSLHRPPPTFRGCACRGHMRSLSSSSNANTHRHADPCMRP